MLEWEDIAAQWLNDYAPMGAFVVDGDLKIRFWNRWMVVHTGKDADFVKGKPLFSVCPEIETRGMLGITTMPFQGKPPSCPSSFTNT